MPSIAHDTLAAAYRAATFFDGARAARLGAPATNFPTGSPLTAPKFRDGFEVARAVVNIVGVWARGAYIVQDVRRGDQWLAFTSELRTL